MRTIHVAFLAFLWLALATVAGAAEVLPEFAPPAPQVILGGSTLLLLLAGTLIPPLRHWTLTVDLRIPVAFHLTRFVGAYFLILYQQGRLPFAFAVPGGIGDILTATLALGLIAFVPPHGRGRRLYLAWNIFGFLDILGVVTTAANQGAMNPATMQPLTRLPLFLLIAFVVPIIIATHILLFIRLCVKQPPSKT